MRAFSDLRLNRDAGQTDESFWPSFTDLMMVVVMIFLISSSVLIMRNWELIRQISETTEAERLASEQARVTIAENATLEERLVATQQQLELSRLQLLRSLERRALLQRQLEREQARNEALERERGALEGRLSSAETRGESLTTDVAALRQQLIQTQQQLGATREQLANTEQQLASTSGELAGARQQMATTRSQLSATQQQLLATQTELSVTSDERSQLQTQFERATERLSLRQSELAEARVSIADFARERNQRDEVLATAVAQGELSEERLAELRKEYLELKAKYDKLVRPARTTKGKHVVALRYSGINGERIIELREPQDAAYRRVDEGQMHQQLTALKASLGGQLYIRIIFPEDSQLSYNEAWSFTSEILSQYDYYYQDGAAPDLVEQPPE